MRWLVVFLLACSSTAPVEPPRHFDPESSGCDPDYDPGEDLDDALFDYRWTCEGIVAPAGESIGASTLDTCPGGTWPDLPVAQICPTQSATTRFDPASNTMLPPTDARTLPMELAPQESGSFRASGSSFPARIKIVSWNMKYTESLDRQIELLTTHPQLADADVYLLSEVDRCTLRNGQRRAARELARAIGGDYVYAVEFVELDIGRTIHGDTGQAIVSRRPLTSASVTCHTRTEDWFASNKEPRLGQRVRLAADVPLGTTQLRVHAIHLESSDVLGEKRAVQSKELLDRAQIEACERPQVMAGDWNAWYCTAPELEVLRRAGFVDATRKLGDIAPTHDGGLRLDMLWQRGLSIVDAGVVRELDASDHDAVWATLEL